MKWIKLTLFCFTALFFIISFLYLHPYRWKTWKDVNVKAMLNQNGETIELSVFRLEEKNYLFIYGIEPEPFIIDASGKTPDRVYFASYRRMYKIGNILIQRQEPLVIVPPGKADYTPNVKLNADYLVFDLYEGEGQIMVPISLIE